MLTVNGIHLGMQTPPRGPATVVSTSEGVSRVYRGTSLERDGQPLLTTTSTVEETLAALGPPAGCRQTADALVYPDHNLAVVVHPDHLSFELGDFRKEPLWPGPVGRQGIRARAGEWLDFEPDESWQGLWAEHGPAVEAVQMRLRLAVQEADEESIRQLCDELDRLWP